MEQNRKGKNKSLAKGERQEEEEKASDGGDNQGAGNLVSGIEPRGDLEGWRDYVSRLLFARRRGGRRRHKAQGTH